MDNVHTESYAACEAWRLKFGVPLENKSFDMDSLIPKIPRWPFEGDGRPSVLFIDETHNMTSLLPGFVCHRNLNYPKCRHLEASYVFIVRLSKQDHRLHLSSLLQIPFMCNG